MKKILFSDRYGLTQAVLAGKKTMTRRIIPPIEIDWNRRGKVTLPVSRLKGETLFMDASGVFDEDFEYPAPAEYQPRFLTGETVAVAQSYKDAGIPPGYIIDEFHPNIEYEAGWRNKMFVQAVLMPRLVRIVNVRIERMQDITSEDCFREGIFRFNLHHHERYAYTVRRKIGDDETIVEFKPFDSPREAFASLIDKLSGKGTWENNPLVYVYEFQLVK